MSHPLPEAPSGPQTDLPPETMKHEGERECVALGQFPQPVDILCVTPSEQGNCLWISCGNGATESTGLSTGYPQYNDVIHRVMHSLWITRCDICHLTGLSTGTPPWLSTGVVDSGG